jgi:hypothetical protein
MAAVLAREYDRSGFAAEIKVMDANGEYRYLKPKGGSPYRQLFVNGRIMAEILYRQTVGLEPRLPEEVASDYGLPLEAVREAIHYCEHHADVLDADRAMEEASIRAHGLDRWPYAPASASCAMNATK